MNGLGLLFLAWWIGAKLAIRIADAIIKVAKTPNRIFFGKIGKIPKNIRKNGQKAGDSSLSGHKKGNNFESL